MSPEIVNNGTTNNNQPPTITRRKKNKKNNIVNNNNNNINTNEINNVPRSYNFLTDPFNFTTFNYASVPTESMSLPSTNYTNPFKLALNYGDNVNPLRFQTTQSTIEQLSNDFLQLNEMNDYVSLPLVNMNRLNDIDLFYDDGRRRFSDPCLPGSDDTTGGGDSTTNSNEKLIEESNLIKRLRQRINYLNENQKKMNRDLMEMRIELNLLKQQVCIGTTTTSHSREYEPGMLSDIIREVRDAARVREDALLARVKHMIEEKELVLNQFHLNTEKNRNNDRLLRLEEQLKNLNVNNHQTSGGSRSDDNIYVGNVSNDSSVRQVMELETENVQLRKELQSQKESHDKQVKEYEVMLRQKNVTSIGLIETPTSYDNEKTSSDTISVGTIGSSATTNSTIGNLSGILHHQHHHQQQQQQQTPRKITLSGPVTDL